MKRTKNNSRESYLSPRRNDEEKFTFEILGIDPKDWPPPFRMTCEALNAKYERLLKILGKKQFILDFSKALPLLEAYRYLTEIFIYKKDYDLNEGWVCHVTGCGGDCPGCFQRDYCNSLDEIWTQAKMEAELIRRCKRTSGT